MERSARRGYYLLKRQGGGAVTGGFCSYASLDAKLKNLKLDKFIRKLNRSNSPPMMRNSTIDTTGPLPRLTSVEDGTFRKRSNSDKTKAQRSGNESSSILMNQDLCKERTYGRQATILRIIDDCVNRLDHPRVDRLRPSDPNYQSGSLSTPTSPLLRKKLPSYLIPVRIHYKANHSEQSPNTARYYKKSLITAQHSDQLPLSARHSQQSPLSARHSEQPHISALHSEQPPHLARHSEHSQTSARLSETLLALNTSDKKQEIEFSADAQLDQPAAIAEAIDSFTLDEEILGLNSHSRTFRRRSQSNDIPERLVRKWRK